MTQDEPRHWAMSLCLVRFRWSWVWALVILSAGCRPNESEPQAEPSTSNRTVTAEPKDATEHSENGTPISSLPPQPVKSPPRISRSSTETHLRDAIGWMADDLREGRGPYSVGLEETSIYLRDAFSELGLIGPNSDEPALQEFRARVRWKRGASNDFTFTTDVGEQLKLNLFEEYAPQPGSRNGAFECELVFAGYGITAPEFDYDDYAALDVKGKCVIVLRHEPQLYDDASPFNGAKLSPHGSVYRKIANAIEHGAAAVVLVEDRAHLEWTQQRNRGDADGLLKLDGDRLEGCAIPVIHVKRNVINDFLDNRLNAPLDEIETTIDDALVPRSQALAGLRCEGHLEFAKTRSTLKNVVATLPGKGKLAGESIVIGAHYDHVGRGAFGSLAPWTNDIHNGADDNASGTAALVEVARRLVQRESDSQRRVIFIAFSGEEMGLLGSRHYCRYPMFELSDTSAMLNLDMVGRMRRNRRVEVFGTGTSSRFPELLTETFEPRDLKLVSHPEGYGPSDHESFYLKDIPVLHFFTGFHPDYHRPSDDTHEINFEGLVLLIEAVEEVAWTLATGPKATLNSNGSDLFGLGSDSAGQSSITSVKAANRGAGMNVGIDQASGHFVVTRLDPEGLAAAAQVRTGDLILRVNDLPIESFEALQSAFSEAEKQTLLLERDGVRLEVTIED